MIENCKDQSKKRRNWFILLYPDSAVDNWVEVLEKSMVKCAVSPLHDSDINDKGELIKPHHHILLVFNGGARVSQVDDIIASIGAYQHCQIVYDKELAYNYLWHNGQPDKAPYKREDIKHINCNFYDFLSNEYKDILNYIDDNEVKSFATLTRKLRGDNLDNLLKYVSNNCYYVKTYIDEVKSQYELKMANARDLLLQIVDRYDLKNVVSVKDLQLLNQKLKKIGFDDLDIIPNEEV